LRLLDGFPHGIISLVSGVSWVFMVRNVDYRLLSIFLDHCVFKFISHGQYGNSQEQQAQGPRVRVHQLYPRSARLRGHHRLPPVSMHQRCRPAIRDEKTELPAGRSEEIRVQGRPRPQSRSLQ
jgi:hypothetical protein